MSRFLISSGGMNRIVDADDTRTAAQKAVQLESASGEAAELGLITECLQLADDAEPFYVDTVRLCKDAGCWAGDNKPTPLIKLNGKDIRMQLATLKEDRHVAREKYAEYMRAVKQRHCSEYETLKNAYRELLRGRQIIDIVATMRAAGMDDKHRPKLAIMPAHAKLCYFGWDEGQPVFQMKNEWWGRITKSSSFRLPSEIYPGANRQVRARAVVPSIPPSLMPSGCLDKYHILWEAEWEQLPVDPILLKHVGRNLYVVLAQGDLTPLERAVLQPMPAK